MPDKLLGGFDLSRLPSPWRERLGSTDAQLTEPVTNHLTEKLGVKFRYLDRSWEYVIGSVILRDSGDDANPDFVCLRATRHWGDEHAPGLVLGLTWTPSDIRPTDEFIEQWRQKVTDAIRTLPKPASADPKRL
jgi:hypothetical protein